MRFLWVFLLGIASITSWAQEEPPSLTPSLSHIQLKQAPSLGLLLDEHRDFMQQLKTIAGYRIQLFTSNRLQEANAFRLEFINVFDNKKVYIFFNEPNYRVRIGDYTDRVEARQALEIIQEEFPEAIIVKDQINLAAL